MAWLWSASDGKLIAQLFGDRRLNVEPLFSPDSKTLLTYDSDQLVRLWSVSQGETIGSYFRLQSEFDGSIHDPRTEFDRLKYSPDGRTILIRPSESRPRLWRIPAAISGDPQRIRLWTQVVTGMEIRERTSTVEFLDARTWRERGRQLEALGGPPMG